MLNQNTVVVISIKWYTLYQGSIIINLVFDSTDKYVSSLIYSVEAFSFLTFSAICSRPSANTLTCSSTLGSYISGCIIEKYLARFPEVWGLWGSQWQPYHDNCSILVQILSKKRKAFLHWPLFIFFGIKTNTIFWIFLTKYWTVVVMSIKRYTIYQGSLIISIWLYGQILSSLIYSVEAFSFLTFSAICSRPSANTLTCSSTLGSYIRGCIIEK